MQGATKLNVRQFALACVSGSEKPNMKKCPSLKLCVAILAIALPVTVSQAHDGVRHSSLGQPGRPADVTRTLKVEMSEYTFSIHDLKFKAGETIKFVVVNKGKLKHELTIGDADEQLEHRKEMEKMSDMGHDDTAHGMPSNAIHVAPGQTRELIWQFTKAGVLEMACNYPGHADLGMEDSISVE